jgi:hypothetical protein
VQTEAATSQATPASNQRPRSTGQPGPRLELPLLAGVLILGAMFRLHGLNWDGGQWLHPDERRVFFVIQDLGWPASPAEALTAASPLNPRFFAYGSLPFYLLRLVASGLGMLWPVLSDAGSLHLVGRPLAAFLDLGTVFLTYRLARRLWRHPPSRSSEKGTAACGESRDKAWAGPLLAAMLVSCAVIHIQQAHFYTADTLLVFLVMLTLNLAAGAAQGGGWRHRTAMGLALGLALATKLTAAALVLALFTANTIDASSAAGSGASSVNRAASVLRHTAASLAVAAAVFAAVQPYAIIDWQAFVRDTIQESRIAWGALDVPYTQQFAGRLPFLYPIWQTVLWGLGLPVGCLAWAGLGTCLMRWLKAGRWQDTLLLSWAGTYLAATGILHAQYLRYMLPLVPPLSIMAVAMVASWSSRWLRRGGYGLLAVGGLLYGLAFTQIYAEPHSWVTASEWIYRNLPGGSTLAVEVWDTALPLPLVLDGQLRQIEEFEVRMLDLYAEPDDRAKWAVLVTDLAESQYALIASRRLYGSISRLPTRYPLASLYYEKLLAGELGFELVAEFERGPTWLNPRLTPLPGGVPSAVWPDESFVVYDHPRALLFVNTEHLEAAELWQRLQ